MNSETLPDKLCSSKKLGSLAEIRPTIVIDNREQTPLHFTRLQSVRRTLLSGDYSVSGLEHLFAIERKSIPDLVSSVCSSERERFERELHRLRGFRFARLLICGPREDIVVHNYRSNASPKAVLNSLSSFECRYNVPVVFADNEKYAAELIESWGYWFSRQIAQEAENLLKGHETITHADDKVKSAICR